jgi:uncharacterized glyoxalase superfamily protein PhnB
MTPVTQIYLSFDGNCEAAFRFYEQRLGATGVSLFPYANSPMAVPPEWQTKIMHGSITLGGVTVAGSDPPPGGYVQPQGFRMYLESSDPAEIERLFPRDIQPLPRLGAIMPLAGHLDTDPRSVCVGTSIYDGICHFFKNCRPMALLV